MSPYFRNIAVIFKYRDISKHSIFLTIRFDSIYRYRIRYYRNFDNRVITSVWGLHWARKKLVGACVRHPSRWRNRYDVIGSRDVISYTVTLYVIIRFCPATFIYAANSKQTPYPVAAPSIDRVGPRPAIFVWALPWALPLGQEAKTVKPKSPLKRDHSQQSNTICQHVRSESRCSYRIDFSAIYSYYYYYQ